MKARSFSSAGMVARLPNESAAVNPHDGRMRSAQQGIYVGLDL
jgi:hypothetical protein